MLSIDGECKRICTKVGDYGRKRSRKPLGSIDESKYDFDDCFGNSALSVGVAQRIGLKDQDRYDVRVGKFIYAAVFDGHGLSSFAADFCMQYLYEYIKPSGVRKLPDDQVIIDAYHTADDCIRKRMKNVPRTGTCVATVLVQIPDEDNFIDHKEEDILQAEVAWVGDCGAILIPENAKPVALTRNHRLTNGKEKRRVEKELENSNERDDLIRSDLWRIDVQEYQQEGVEPMARSFIDYRKDKNGRKVGIQTAFAHTEGVSLQVTRSIGDRKGARSVISTPDISRFSIKKGSINRIIVANGGLFDVFSVDTVSKLASRKKNPRNAAKYLATKAKRTRLYKGAPIDDITVVVLDICF